MLGHIATFQTPVWLKHTGILLPVPACLPALPQRAGNQSCQSELLPPAPQNVTSRDCVGRTQRALLHPNAPVFTSCLNLQFTYDREILQKSSIKGSFRQMTMIWFFFLIPYTCSYMKVGQGYFRKKIQHQRQYCLLLTPKNKIMIWKGVSQADNLWER